MRKGSLSVVAVAFLGACVVGACSSNPDAEGSSADALSVDIDGDVTLTDVQRAIAATGAKWSAGSNVVSALGRSDRAAKLGVPLTDVVQGAVIITEEAVTTREAAPAAFDWRNVDGKNYVSPMMDQGRCGSCVAFASVATLETQLNIAAHDTSSPWQLSPQQLFSCGGGRCSFGWTPGSAARYLTTKGVTDSACMPYTSGAHGDDTRCSAACSDSASRVLKTRGYGTPSSGGMSVAAVKRALQNGPLVASFTVYEDFMFYTGGVYKHVTGARAGGHAVSIIGWSDADSAWIVRNSWGTSWGEGGFFRIAWDDVSGLGQQTWSLDVATPGPYVELAGIRDGVVLSGQHTLTFDAQSLGSAPISWTLTNSDAPAAQGGSADGTSAVIDTTRVADGVYTLQAHGGAGAARVDGPPHLVYVLNGTETGSVRFTSITAGQKLSGTATFEVAVAASPVPATHVEWTIKNAAGEVIVSRSTENTGPKMQLGWNTKRWPNGAYTIAATGGVGTQSLEGTSVPVIVQN